MKTRNSGFQRLLDRKRAEEIADYIDNQHGTIPTLLFVGTAGSRGEGYRAWKTLQFRTTSARF